MDNEILNNIYETIQNFYPPLKLGGILLGLILFSAGLIKWAHGVKYPGKVSKASIAGLLLGGLMLMNTNAILTLFTQTLLGGGNALKVFTFHASVAPGRVNYTSPCNVWARLWKSFLVPARTMPRSCRELSVPSIERIGICMPAVERPCMSSG